MKKDENFVAVWLESESSLNLDYMINIFGVDPKRFYIISMDRETGAEEALDRMEALISTGSVDICVVNTLKALIPLTELNKSLKEVSVATQARLNSTLMGHIVTLIADTNTAMVLIQQRTTQIGGYISGNTVLAGGMRIRYQSMLTVALHRSKIDKLDPIAPEEGVKIRCRVEKNHCLPSEFPYVTFNYFAIYGEGIETILSTLDLAVNQKILRRAGAHIYQDNPDDADNPLQHWKSKNDFREYCLNNPEFLDNLMNNVTQDVKQLTEKEINDLQEQEREEAKAAGVDIPDPTVDIEQLMENK